MEEFRRLHELASAEQEDPAQVYGPREVFIGNFILTRLPGDRMVIFRRDGEAMWTTVAHFEEAIRNFFDDNL